MSNVYKSLQLSHLGTEKECHLVIPALIKRIRQNSNLKPSDSKSYYLVVKPCRERVYNSFSVRK